MSLLELLGRGSAGRDFFLFLYFLCWVSRLELLGRGSAGKFFFPLFFVVGMSFGAAGVGLCGFKTIR